MTTHYKAHQGIHRVHHKGHVCPICNQAFSRQDKLDAHLASQHSSANNVTKPESRSNLLNNLLNEVLGKTGTKASESMHYSIVVGNVKN